MLDPVREKCDLHIRAAGIFVMQLELLEIQRLVALSHNEAPIVAEEPIFATAQRDERWSNHRHSHVAFWVASRLRERETRGGELRPFLKLDAFPVCRRTKG